MFFLVGSSVLPKATLSGLLLTRNPGLQFIFLGPPLSPEDRVMLNEGGGRAGWRGGAQGGGRGQQGGHQGGPGVS